MKSLRVLHIEDSERDATMTTRALRDGGYEVFTQRVENAEALSAALSAEVWDVILSDYSLLDFDAFSALALLRSSGLDIPFIIISGTTGEETVVRAMVAGASDYLVKDNLARLVPAIERELNEAKILRIAREAEENLIGLKNELQAAVKGYERVLDNSLDIICSIDEDGHFASVNKASYEIWGYEPGELIGKSYKSLVHPDDHAFTEQAAVDVMKGRSVTNFENRYFHKDGKVVRVMWSAKWLESDKKMFCVARDITEGKRIENELGKSREWLNAIVEGSRDGIFVEENDIVVFANKALAELYGYESPEEMIGSHISRFRSSDDDQRMLDYSQKRLAGHAVPSTYEFKGVNRDGGLFDVEVSVSSFASGGKSFIVSNLRDITERKHVEKELRKSREHMALAQRVARLGSWETDLSTFAVTWSEETYRILEVDVESFLPTHQGFLQIVHPDDRAAVDKAFVDSLVQHSDCSLQHRLLMPDGRIKFIKEQWEVQCDANDIPVTAIGTCQDITRRTLAEASQRESEERLRLLFEQMRDGFYYSTPDGRLLDINPAMIEMFGYSSREEMLKVDVTRDLYFSAEDRKSRPANDGLDDSEVYRMRRKDGSAIWVEDRGQFKYDQEENSHFIKASCAMSRNVNLPKRA